MPNEWIVADKAILGKENEFDELWNLLDACSPERSGLIKDFLTDQEQQKLVYLKSISIRPDETWILFLQNLWKKINSHDPNVEFPRFSKHSIDELNKITGDFPFVTGFSFKILNLLYNGWLDGFIWNELNYENPDLDIHFLDYNSPEYCLKTSNKIYMFLIKLLKAKYKKFKYDNLDDILALFRKYCYEESIIDFQAQNSIHCEISSKNIKEFRYHLFVADWLNFWGIRGHGFYR